MGFLSGLFGGRSSRPSRVEQVPRFTPEQSAFQNQILSQLGPLLAQAQQPQQKFDFGPIAQQARTQFREQTVPSLAERFTEFGAGAQRSSAFPAALGRAGAGLEESLASQQSQIGLQQQQMEQQRLQGLISALMGAAYQPSFESYYTPRTQGSPGMLQNLLLGGLQGGLGFLSGGLFR